MGWMLLGLQEAADEQAAARTAKAEVTYGNAVPAQASAVARAEVSQGQAVNAVRKIDGALSAQAAGEGQRSAGFVAMIAAAQAVASELAADVTAKTDRLDLANTELGLRAAAMASVVADVREAIIAMTQAKEEWTGTEPGPTAKQLETSIERLLRRADFMLAQASGLPAQAGGRSRARVEELNLTLPLLAAAIAQYESAREAASVEQAAAVEELAASGAALIGELRKLTAQAGVYAAAAAAANQALSDVGGATAKHEGAASMAAVVADPQAAAGYMRDATAERIRKQEAARRAEEEAARVEAVQGVRGKLIGG